MLWVQQETGPSIGKEGAQRQYPVMTTERRIKKEVLSISLRLAQTGVIPLAPGNAAVCPCQWGAFGCGSGWMASSAARKADQDVTCLTWCLEARKNTSFLVLCFMFWALHKPPLQQTWILRRSRCKLSRFSSGCGYLPAVAWWGRSREVAGIRDWCLFSVSVPLLWNISVP